MTLELSMLRADARIAPPDARHAFAGSVLTDQPPGTVLLATCHRVELLGEPAAIAAARALPSATRLEHLEGPEVARHLLRVAVGLESVVMGEDQVLHQLRTAVAAARGRGPLPPSVDHLADLALRAGRRARSWLPANRPTLADVALDRVGAGTDGRVRPVLLVGAGAMGALAARAVHGRGLPLLVASRTPERAARLAADWHGRPVAMDPGPEVARTGGVIVALSGPWRVAPRTVAAITAGPRWVVDLSSPAAVDPDLVRALGSRHVSIDDLRPTAGAAGAAGAAGHDGLRTRLEGLVSTAMHELLTWSAAAADRQAARGLAALATDARNRELDALWHEVGDLGPDERAAIERMAERLTQRLLRDPLERLGGDGDGRYGRAALELFRL